MNRTENLKVINLIIVASERDKKKRVLLSMYVYVHVLACTEFPSCTQEYHGPNKI